MKTCGQLYIKDLILFFSERKVLVVFESDSALNLKIIKYLCSHGLNVFYVNQFTLQIKSDISKSLKRFFMSLFEYDVT